LQSQVTDSARELESSVRQEYETARSAIEAPAQEAVADLHETTRLAEGLPAAVTETTTSKPAA
jgi:sec-independent protein translocase protein TatB